MDGCNFYWQNELKDLFRTGLDAQSIACICSTFAIYDILKVISYRQERCSGVEAAL